MSKKLHYGEVQFPTLKAFVIKAEHRDCPGMEFYVTSIHGAGMVDEVKVRLTSMPGFSMSCDTIQLTAIHFISEIAAQAFLHTLNLHKLDDASLKGATFSVVPVDYNQPHTLSK